MKIIRSLSRHESATVIVINQLFTQSSKHEIHSLKPNPMHQLFNEKRCIYILHIFFGQIQKYASMRQNKETKDSIKKGTN